MTFSVNAPSRTIIWRLRQNPAGSSRRGSGPSVQRGGDPLPILVRSGPAVERQLIPKHGLLSANHQCSALRAWAWRSPEPAGMSGIVGTADRYLTLGSREDCICACDDIEQLAASLAEDRSRGRSHAAVPAARDFRLIPTRSTPKLIERSHSAYPADRTFHSSNATSFPFCCWRSISGTSNSSQPSALWTWHVLRITPVNHGSFFL